LKEGDHGNYFIIQSK